MKKIITYGTFDVIHEWHLNILRRAKELWDYLIVWISSDNFNDIKWKKSFQTFEERKKILEWIKYVNKVIAEDNWEQKEKDIQKYNINIFTMWSDWKWKFDNLNKYCNVIYLPRTEGISSTKIRNNIFSMFLNKIDISINNNSHMFKKLSMKLSSIILIPFYYIFSHIVKKEKWLYIFGSMNWMKISGNSKAMFDYYKERPNVRRYYLTRNNTLISENTIKINSFKNIKLILKAEYIFTDSSASSVSWALALIWNFNIVRLWHWDTIKKLNFDSDKYLSSIGQLGGFLLKNEYKNNILIPTSSKKNQEIMNSCFLSNSAKITGLPRNDIFFKDNKSKIKEKIDQVIGISKYDKVYLYTPTWRDSTSIIKPFSNEILTKINNYMKDNNYLFLISWHIQTEDISFTEMSNIKNFKSDKIDTQELLVISDVLITDYSSIYIDFLLTDKPIIFYAYDYENYLNQDRELYFNYNDVIIKNTLIKNEYDFYDTLQNISNIENDIDYKNNHLKVKNFFHEFQNWNYCKKVDEFISK